MTQYCSGKSESTVNISFPNKKERIISKYPPVDVVINQSQTTGDCLYYFGQGVGASYENNSYNGFHKGTVSFISATHPQYNIACVRLVLNEIVTDNYYGSPYGSRLQTAQERLTTGCTESDCEIIVSDTTGQIYQKKSICPIKYTVACDVDCPPNYCKCITTKYPGYCCISCKDVAQRINNVTSRI